MDRTRSSWTLALALGEVRRDSDKVGSLLLYFIYQKIKLIDMLKGAVEAPFLLDYLDFKNSKYRYMDLRIWDFTLDDLV